MKYPDPPKAVEDNIHKPKRARIIETKKLTEQDKLYKVRFQESEIMESLEFKPGQFMEISIPGVGEIPISIASSPTRKGLLELCVRNVGRVTKEIHRLGQGDFMDIRGPYGNGFPMENLKGNDLVFVAGGLGYPPLRGALNYAIDKNEFGEIYFAYGEADSSSILFEDEVRDFLMKKGDKVNVESILALENNDLEEPNLDGERVIEGMVTEAVQQMDIDPSNTYAIVCGPPIMYKFVIAELLEKNLSPYRIYMTLERRMECGVGKCGHCKTATANSMRQICVDGPVFTYWDVLVTRTLI